MVIDDVDTSLQLARRQLDQLGIEHELFLDSTEALKASKQAAVTFGLLSVLGMSPSSLQKPVLDILSQKASAVLTNVPGQQHPLWLAGSKMTEMIFWVPQSGAIGLGISILSYDGKVFFGVIGDRRLVPDPDQIIGRFRLEFEKLLYLAMMLPLEGRPASHSADVLIDSATDN